MLNDMAAVGVAAVIVFVLATILGAIEWLRKIFRRDIARPSGS